jgi:hypothetical protein
MTRPFTTSLRIGDVERDAAVTALNRHFAEGRLTTLEHDERITLALAARTSDDLDKLFADLPPLDAPRSAQSRSRGPAAAAGRFLASRVVPIPVALLCVAFALFVIVHLIPIIAVIALLFVVRGMLMRRHFGGPGARAWQGHRHGRSW